MVAADQIMSLTGGVMSDDQGYQTHQDEPELVFAEKRRGAESDARQTEGQNQHRGESSDAGGAREDESEETAYSFHGLLPNLLSALK